MKIVLLAVGKLRSAPVRELCLDYLERLQRYGPVDVLELKAGETALRPQGVGQESARILAALEPSDQIFVLDERGSALSSPELSGLLTNAELRSVKRLVFVLGGAYGLSDEVKKKGKLIALSKLTFPHELCRAIVLEQLYRARTIQRGEPYHH